MVTGIIERADYSDYPKLSLQGIHCGMLNSAGLVVMSTIALQTRSDSYEKRINIHTLLYVILKHW